ncbi:unnamed protein product [Meganyctiphanes norvegica]|uniref:Potassium channel domain-containing protein n=1 Tax=Meganyctiphanes norvegica TaxID=48144 RepID=A0AAV2Q701_MEGNR
MAPDDEIENYYKKKPKSVSSIICSILFSHVGLLFIVGAYAAIGAYAFVEIERPNEMMDFENKKAEAARVEETIDYISNLFWFYADKNWTDFKQYNETIFKDLKKMEDFIISAVQNHAYDGTIDGWSDTWTFSSALLLTMTIMSTIGYGHIAPATFWGKIFCIIYALIGCPLLLIFLAQIGDAMATSFTYIYSRLCCRWCRSKRNQSELPAKASKKKLKLLMDDVVGKEDYMPTEEVNVPITLTLVLLFSFMIAGAILFAFLEEWEPYAAFYFTFISLSTIGFGDMYPERTIVNATSTFGAYFKMFVCVLYILFGMAMLSMCINLMQEQVIEKCKWIGEKLGGLTDRSKVKDTKDVEKNRPSSPSSSMGSTKDLLKARSPSASSTASRATSSISLPGIIN